MVWCGRREGVGLEGLMCLCMFVHFIHFKIGRERGDVLCRYSL